MAHFRIVKFSELRGSWLPQDYIPESYLLELLEIRNKKIKDIDSRLKTLDKVDDEIVKTRRKIGMEKS